MSADDEVRGMERQVVTVPESFQAFGRWQRKGPAGRSWFANLPYMIADCDQQSTAPSADETSLRLDDRTGLQAPVKICPSSASTAAPTWRYP